MSVANFWSTVPVDRLVYLRGATPEYIELALEDANDAPATLVYSIGPLLAVPDLVTSMLGELDRAARGLFTQWLPDASPLGASSAGLAAVRALASRRAHDLDVPAALLADLAMRAIKGLEPRRRDFPAETRASSLTKVIAAALGRARLAVLIRGDSNVPGSALEQTVAAGQWLAHHGRLGVWLAGDAWRTIGHVAALDVPSPAQVEQEEELGELPPAAYPAVRGVPRWNSRAEQALEAALSGKEWADGRGWNEPYQSDALSNPISIDLVWFADRCAVEVDGPEHRLVVRFEADRRRDVRLQLDGFAVLRFTNAQIDHDVGAVVSQIEQFLTLLFQ